MAVSNDWREYKLLVLAELERLDTTTARLREAVAKIEQKCVQHNFVATKDATKDEVQPDVEVAVVRWKFWSGVVALIAAIITSIVTAIVSLFHK